MPRHIVIFEPEAGGHQMEYIRHLVTDMRDRMDVRFTLLTTAQAARHKNCERLVRDFADSLTPRIVPEPQARHRVFRLVGQYLEYQWRSAQMARAAMEELGWDKIDFVLLPHLESIGLRRPAAACVRGQALGNRRDRNALPSPVERNRRIVALDRPYPGTILSACAR